MTIENTSRSGFWNTRALQLLAIIEGIPPNLSMLDPNLYNYQTLYLMLELNDNPFPGAKEVLEYMTQAIPNEVNFRTDNFLSELFISKLISEEVFDKARSCYHKIDMNNNFAAMKKKVRPLEKNYRLACHKYDLKKEKEATCQKINN